MAQLLLLIGLLALSAMASVVASRLGSAELETRVRVAAQAQLEELLAGGYSTVVSGETATGIVQLEWQVSGSGPRRVVLMAQGTMGQHAAGDTVETWVSR